MHVKLIPDSGAEKGFKISERISLSLTQKDTIMHSKIFQITTVKVTNEGRLTENTLTQGDVSFYDYPKSVIRIWVKAYFLSRTQVFS